MIQLRSPLSLCLPIVICAAITATGQEMAVKPGEQGVWVMEGNKRVLFFQRKTKSLDGQHARANYLHPIYDLRGNVISEDFPDDHKHHRGFFWTWHQVWIGDTKIGDPWTCKDFRWDVKQVAANAKTDVATLKTLVHWFSPNYRVDEVEQPIVEERAILRVHVSTLWPVADSTLGGSSEARQEAATLPDPRSDGSRIVDFEIQLRALVDNVRIGGSEDVKGYGGFSTRIKLPEDIVFFSTDGPVEPQTTAINAGPWMTMNGGFENKLGPDGITVMGHPSNPGSPQPWILRRKRSMQNIVYPGRQAVELATNAPLTLRYRVVLHSGAVDAAQANEWYEHFANSAQTSQDSSH